MTLYNKDGSVYRLNGPNPIMKEQQIWNKFVVHNMKWRPEYKDDGTVIMPLESDLSLSPRTQTEVFLDELSKSKETDPEVITPIIEKKIEIREAPKEKSKLGAGIEKTFVYCLPAIIKEKTDNLYGDIFKLIQYDKPTSFEAVILSQSDMSIEMWSSVTFEKGSILYPKNNDKRWWKINETFSKMEGWIIKAIPSQDQPSFEG